MVATLAPDDIMLHLNDHKESTRNFLDLISTKKNNNRIQRQYTNPKTFYMLTKPYWNKISKIILLGIVSRNKKKCVIKQTSINPPGKIRSQHVKNDLGHCFSSCVKGSSRQITGLYVSLQILRLQGRNAEKTLQDTAWANIFLTDHFCTKS